MMKFLAALLIFLVIAVYLCLITLTIPQSLLQKWQASAIEHCEGCQLNISKAHISFWHRQLILDNIIFSSGDPQFTAIEAKIDSIRIVFSIRKLFHKSIHISHMEIMNPNVQIMEGDKVYPQEKPGAKMASTEMEVLATNIQNGIFTYNRTYRRGIASIHITQIMGEIQSWNNHDNTAKTKGNASGLLEQSGRFSLAIESPIFAENTQAEIGITMKELVLSNMNPFFETSEGINLLGNLHEAKANVIVIERTLSADVRAKYSGLDIHFQKTNRRGPIAAFLSNLVESIKVNSTNEKRSKRDQIRGILAKRRNHESLVSFILRGMKEAALKVATD